MLPPMDSHMRLQLASPGACLAVAHFLSITGFAHAHALPRQTTVAFHVLDVLAYPPPPAPTPFPRSPGDLRRRQTGDGFNTICGYIGGDPGLPATCSLGSHCVVDTNVGAIGCCPNEGLCTTGVFTSCVDGNSGPQLEVNPYVYTCAGSDVCYRNQFEGGNFQYGCGSASDLAATVAPTASGQTGAGLTVVTVSAPLTQEPTTLSEPTTLGTISRASLSSASDTTTQSNESDTTSDSSSASTSPTSSLTTTTTSSDSPSSTDSSPTDNTPTPTGDAPDAAAGGGINRTGAIIGGSISGAVLLFGLIAVAFFFWKRKQRGNARKGPGPGGDTQYVIPMTGGGGFAPVPSSQESYEQNYHPEHGTTTTILGGKGLADPGRHPSLSARELDTPFAYGPSGEVVATRGLTDSRPPGYTDTNDDQIPLTYEYDDFSRGFNDALSRIEEEDSRPATAVNNSGMGGYGNGHGAGADDQAAGGTGSWSPRRGEGPLWQQNRRQSRNMMWMQPG